MCFYITFVGSALALNRKQNISCRNSASKWGNLTLFWIRHSSHFCFPLALQNCSPWMYQCVPRVAAANYHLCLIREFLPFCSQARTGPAACTQDSRAAPRGWPLVFHHQQFFQAFAEMPYQSVSCLVIPGGQNDPR